MSKLPVGKTIIDAYGFTFTQLGTIIGLIWFPMVISTLLNFLPELADGYADANLPAAAQVENFAITLLTLLLSAIMYVSVARQALGLRQGPAVFHFALAQPEFRVYGALLVLWFFFIFALIVVVEVANLAMASSAVAAAVLLVAGLCLLVYLLIRLGFLLVPVIVAEGQINFARAWLLSQGNFWRILAVVVAIFAPLVVIWYVTVYALMGKEILAAFPPPQTTDQSVIQQHFLQMQGIAHRHAPQVIFVLLMLAPFSIGLTLSAAASAYRALSVNGTRPAIA